MMREILFRAKRLDNGEWVEGFYLDKMGYRSTDTVYDERRLHLIKGIDRKENNYSHEVDPDTVGQYTGLTDKNGKKIFEGDILLNTTFGDKWVTEYEDGAFVLKLIGDIERVFLGIVVGFAVIGNIHDKEDK